MSERKKKKERRRGSGVLAFPFLPRLVSGSRVACDLPFPQFFSLSRARMRGGRENWCFAEKNFSTTTATACGAKKGAIWGNCVFSGVKFVRYSFGKTGKQLKTFFWAYFSPGMNVSSVLRHCSFSSVFFLDSFQVPKASACLSLALAACDVKGRNIFSNGGEKDVGCVFRF